MAILCLGPWWFPKIDNETLISQHEDSPYYSEFEVEGIMEEGTGKMCHQKIKLGLYADNKFTDNNQVSDDVKNLWNAWTSAVLSRSLASYCADKTSGKCRRPFSKRWKWLQKMKVYWWREKTFQNCLQNQGKYENVRTNFEGLYSHQFFKYIFLQKNCLPVLQMKQIYTVVT